MNDVERFGRYERWIGSMFIAALLVIAAGVLVVVTLALANRSDIEEIRHDIQEIRIEVSALTVALEDLTP